MKVLIFIGLKIIEVAAIYLLAWQVPLWVGKTKFADSITNHSLYYPSTNKTAWLKGIDALFTLFIIVGLVSLLVLGAYLVVTKLIDANWNLASQLTESIR